MKDIELNEMITFHCKKCGDCCKKKTDILLSSRDCFQIAKYLNLSLLEFINLYCEMYIGRGSKMPVVRIRMNEEECCPFLKENLCSIQQVKPTVCALFPFSRAVNYIPMKNHGMRCDGTWYVLMNEDCGEKGDECKLKDWIEQSGVNTDDVFYKSWCEFISNTGFIIRQLSKRLPEQYMNSLWNILYSKMYLEYDISKNFEEQYVINTLNITNFLKYLISKLEI